jgi:hypothetical protein
MVEIIIVVLSFILGGVVVIAIQIVVGILCRKPTPDSVHEADMRDWIKCCEERRKENAG